mmetsp:Transcript_28343/g.71102  ORF Transcript_28343/g.71102 Transcript_28343/m.71102 type:complete len:242 (+) Transcript_28343:915-1640(+)
MDRYESDNPVYFPTIAIVSSPLCDSAVDAIFAHRSSFTGSLHTSLSVLISMLHTPCFCSISGILYVLLTSCTLTTASGDTWQNIPSFFFVSSSSGRSLRHTIRSGDSPIDARFFTPCCVGFVFCSPTTPSSGTRLTNTLAKFSTPTSYFNCLNASINGMLSISPTVPPSSITHTSGTSPVRLSGFTATSRIQSCTASVTCGTTCTVFPRYSPRRSRSITCRYTFPVVMLFSRESVTSKKRS